MLPVSLGANARGCRPTPSSRWRRALPSPRLISGKFTDTAHLLETHTSWGYCRWYEEHWGGISSRDRQSFSPDSNLKSCVVTRVMHISVSPVSRVTVCEVEGDATAYSTSLGCRRQLSLACHAWNHGKSQKSSPLSQQCRFHCHRWSAGESHYCVNSKGFMKFGTHTNEESKIYINDCHYPTLLAFLPNILRSHMAVWLSFWKPTVSNNPMFPISPAQPWWCQYMTFSTSLAIFVLTGSPRKGFVLRNPDVYLTVRRKKSKQTVEWPIEIG